MKLHGAAAATVFVGGIAEDTIKNIEWFRRRHKGADHLTGDGLDNKLVGNGGNYSLKGKGGIDTLTGGWGKDVLSGGRRQRPFLFQRCADCRQRRQQSSILPTAPTTSGWRKASSPTSAPRRRPGLHHFFAVGTAHDLNDRIIYKPGSGALLYDADANGSGHGVVFAHLAPHLALDGFDDFFRV